MLNCHYSKKQHQHKEILQVSFSISAEEKLYFQEKFLHSSFSFSDHKPPRRQKYLMYLMRNVNKTKKCFKAPVQIKM